MLVDHFLSRHGLRENPFEAEEARDDPVLERLLDSGSAHPDFAKILGRIDRPTTSVVFGEKGSGKTAIRLLVARRVAAHNRENPARKTLLVAYDDLNPVIDRITKPVDAEGRDSDGPRIDALRLEDHQDAILSLALTRLIDLILARPDRGSSGPPSRDAAATLLPRARKLPREARARLAVMAAIYDQGGGGPLRARWMQLRSGLRLRRTLSAGAVRHVATAFLVLGLVCLGAGRLAETMSSLLYLSGGMAVALGMAIFTGWIWRHIAVWRIARRVAQQARATGRGASDLQWMLLRLKYSDLADQAWPSGGPEGRTRRYQLTLQLLEILGMLDFTGLMVLVDRVDEPTQVSGSDQNMRSLVWPMLDNKFLKQEGVGIKLLLPIELRHHLLRESPQFFQEARLDKQNLVDRLAWSGPTLYDLCSARLAACQRTSDSEEHATDKPGDLMALFGQDVTRDMIVDALDAMQQPRDAFKFLYGLIQEHCRVVPDDQPIARIPRLTVEAVRRNQAQRVSDFQRGLGPG